MSSTETSTECLHEETRVELTPHLTHYGKLLCAVCGRFLRWAKDPKKAIIVIQDTREQHPLELEKYGLAVEVGTLSYGDYTIKQPNLTNDLVIERKSLPDFVACCGRERERFEREIIALRGYRNAYVVGEFGLRDILGQNYRSQINPNAVLSSIARWQTYGIHFVFCDTHEGASYITAKLLQFHAEYWTSLAREIVTCAPSLAQMQAQTAAQASFLNSSTAWERV